MRAVTRLLIVAALAFGSGCAQTDWIDRTLVTVDVTGVWISHANNDIWLELKQEGTKVAGSYKSQRWFTNPMHREGPLYGTLAGDVFSFNAANGAMTGELTVDRDEMSGYVRFFASVIATSFRRVSPASQPGQQRQ